MKLFPFDHEPTHDELVNVRHDPACLLVSCHNQPFGLSARLAARDAAEQDQAPDPSPEA